jgi:hypothetical protein
VTLKARWLKLPLAQKERVSVWSRSRFAQVGKRARGVAHGEHDEGRRCAAARRAVSAHGFFHPGQDRHDERRADVCSSANGGPRAGVWMDFDQPTKIKSTTGWRAGCAGIFVHTEVYRHRPGHQLPARRHNDATSIAPRVSSRILCPWTWS